ncbi:CYTH and CHAD domain-containing protein [Amycolatopsis minnesotensis]|uniref:CHAD domain-containing protein n=1 Tax=Amycolatopsis minnesotensis TaxID=337894 RepID=A0ABN2R6J7_9PSEU
MNPVPLLALPDVSRVWETEPVEITETYFDTAGLRLYARGVTLCRTVGGDAPGWHLDLGAESVPVTGTPGPPTVPRELRRLVNAFTRGDELEPVAKIQVNRTRDLALNDEGDVLVAVVLDTVSASSALDRTSTAWTERHVDPGTGGRVFARLAGQRCAAARASRTATVARVLGPRRHRSYRALTGRDLVLRYLRTQVAALPFLDCAVRREAPDAAVRIRETARRIRLVLEHCAPLIGGKKLTKTLRAELGWFASAFAPACDDEAQWPRLRAGLGRVPDSLGPDGAAVLVDEYFAARAADHRATVVEVLDSLRYRGLLDELDQVVLVLAEEPECDRPDLARLPAGEVLRDFVAGAGEQVGRRIAALVDAEERGVRSTAAHRALNAVRRFGCLLEVFAQDRPLLREVRTWQRSLEEHRAAVLAMRHLADLAKAAGEGSPVSAFVLLRQLEGDAAARSAADLAWHWRDGAPSSIHCGR